MPKKANTRSGLLQVDVGVDRKQMIVSLAKRDKVTMAEAIQTLIDYAVENGLEFNRSVEVVAIPN